MGPWGPPTPPVVNLLLSQWRKTVTRWCTTLMKAIHTLKPCVLLLPQAAPVRVLLLQAVCSDGSRPSVYKQPARASSAPPQPSKVEATPPSMASVFLACCGLWAGTLLSSYWPVWVCNRTPRAATGLDPLLSVWVLMVNSVHFRQQSQLDEGHHEQSPVRALLGWALFSGRGHFFITRVRKHSFQGWGDHILVTSSLV